MKTKNGASTIVYKETPEGKKFLVLHRVKKWTGYEFAKGGIEEGENPEEAAKRELEEETGITKTSPLKKIEGKMQWEKNNKKYNYDVFVAKVDENEKVKLPGIIEHDNYEWVSEKDVLNKLSKEENKEFFKKALKKIEKK